MYQSFLIRARPKCLSAGIPRENLSLRFDARASFPLNVGDICGVSQGTCCEVIRRVTAAIRVKKMHFIHFLDTPEERRDVTEGILQDITIDWG